MTLEIIEISKQIENDWVLRNLSFSVKRGEIFGILGSDDDSKTVILRVLSGVDSPDSGSIRFDGDPVTNGRKNGFHFLSDESTSRWQAMFSRSSSRELAITHAARVRDALTKVKSVLLVENPVQSLDSALTAAISTELISKTLENNLCTVVATTDPLEIFQLCHRVGILSGGEIIQIGTPEEVYTMPNSIVAAKLFGNCNLIPAKRLTSNKTEIPEFYTVEGEHRLSTGTVEKGELGAINQSVMLSIRPEHISISFGASFPEDNLVKARVKRIAFQGPTTIITLNANGLELKAVVLRIVGLEPGEECIVGLPPDRIRILTK